uniref:Uncharacterized protein n=1 Tax=Rhizophora mucronata TaxID=61149 RepID=A0A2P2QJJ8_RHIMU
MVQRPKRKNIDANDNWLSIHKISSYFIPSFEFSGLLQSELQPPII